MPIQLGMSVQESKKLIQNSINTINHFEKVSGASVQGQTIIIMWSNLKIVSDSYCSIETLDFRPCAEVPVDE